VRGDPGLALTGVSTDTRTLTPGQLFLALRGASFDGERFAPAAVERGAPAVLLGPSEDPGAVLTALEPGVAVLRHADPRRALGDLASWFRSTLPMQVLGITGSCGKTTTKNIVQQLFAPLMPVVASPSSFNNDIGVPLTLLSCDSETRLAAVEMGTNHPGEIAALCRIARPDHAIVTNVGASHLAGLGSLEGVAREKGDLLAAVPTSGFCVLNAGSRFRAELASRTAARLVTFSVEGEDGARGDLDARDLYFHSGGTTFRLGDHEVTTPLLGTHNVENLLAALCVGLGLGIELESLLAGVAGLHTTRSRMERFDLAGITVFDDCYNANPESLRAAVRVLAGLHGFRRRVLVLADMLELGGLSAELHHQVGREAARAGVDALVLAGTWVKATAAGALEGGLPATAITHFAGTDEAAQGALELVQEGDVVLVKGSRGMALEKVVDALRERWTEAAGNR
jgi:UDP-N-acetylmuramoyl-tripeptide--D-alanyl-D-alanine ligase